MFTTLQSHTSFQKNNNQKVALGNKHRRYSMISICYDDAIITFNNAISKKIKKQYSTVLFGHSTVHKVQYTKKFGGLF